MILGINAQRRRGDGAPQPAFSNVKLLLHCNARPFMDSSAAERTIAHGRTSGTGPTLETTTTRFGGGSLLTSAGHALWAIASTDFVMGTGPWMMDAWVYKTNASDVYIFDQRPLPSTDGFVLVVTGAAGAVLAILNSTNYGSTSPAVTVANNVWTHVAASYDGTNVRTFVNGAVATTTAASINLTNNSQLTIGNTHQINSGGAHYIDELRVVKGEAVYTAAFTVPSSAPPDTGLGIIAAAPAGTYSNVKALLHFESSLTDNSGSPKTYTARGSAAVSSAQAQWGSQSLLLNGSSQWIDTPAHADWDFGTGDWTLEAWVRPSSVASTHSIWSTYNPPGPNGWLLDLVSSGCLRLFGLAAVVLQSTSGYTVATNVWTHVAACRISDVIYLYINGECVGFVINTQNFDSATSLFLGQLRDPSPANYFNGYIDDARILKAEGVYPRSFIVPAAAFADS